MNRIIKNIKDNAIYCLVFFLLILFDQLVKVKVQSSPAIFKNYDFAFSLKLPISLIYLTYLILVGLLISWFLKKQNYSWFDKLGFVCILAGAISNIGERIIRGYVIDFIHIYNGVLNFADLFIILGILLLLFEPKVKTNPNL